MEKRGRQGGKRGHQGPNTFCFRKIRRWILSGSENGPYVELSCGHQVEAPSGVRTLVWCPRCESATNGFLKK